ncbi:hypothetical protein [Wenzhouxiangella sp. EGI_FJ10409]|uniref:hypothetical protein n=1 Tax=Wenzhouxiangella sp. EGI_FJ10409 TaxID=3243767 RepID=UPI0035D9A78A
MEDAIEGVVIKSHSHIDASGPIKDSEIEGRSVEVARGVDTSKVYAKKGMQVLGNVGSGADIRCGGNSRFDGSVDGALSWRAEEAGNLEVEGQTIGVLQVESDTKAINDDIPILTLGSKVVEIDELRLRGALKVSTTERADSRQPESIVIQKLTVSEGARSSSHILAEGKRGLSIECLDWKGSLYISFVPDKTSSELSIGELIGRDLHLCSNSKTRIAKVSSESSNLDTCVSLYNRGPFEIDRALAQVRCAEGSAENIKKCNIKPHKEIPELSIPQNGLIMEVSGKFKVHEIDGRISGREPSRIRMGSPKNQRGKRSNCAKLIRISKSEGRVSGQIECIDPTELPYSDIDSLEQLHVFHPNSYSMIRYAKDFQGNSFEVAAAAQKAQRLAESVINRAIAGSSRSAAIWMALRLHHKSLPITKIEWWMRWVHRAFGYSQRPGPAAATWLVVVSLLALLPWCAAINDSQPITYEPLGYKSRFMAMLLLPGALLRLPSIEAPLLYGSQSWYILAFVIVGVPLVYFILALRNFLSSPLAKH